MLHRDSLFRRRDEQGALFRRRDEGGAPVTASASAAAPSAAQTPAPSAPAVPTAITDCDTLVVEGRIEATLDARVLQIASSGVFQGTVAVDVAEIHGSVEGELTVRKQLILHATGRVSGKIRYAKIKVEEGAELSGEIGLLDSGAVARVARPQRVANPAA